MRRKVLQKICEGCSTSFEVLYWARKRRFCGKVCSTKLGGRPKIKKVLRECLGCKILFKDYPKSFKAYCSHTCYTNTAIGHPNYGYKSGQGFWLGKNRTLETRQKISQNNWARKASSFHLKSIREKIRLLPEYKEWRKSVFIRDNFICVQCKTGGEIQADHIIPLSKIVELMETKYGEINILEHALNFELLWDIDNGRTLCLPCHYATDTYGSKAIIYNRKTLC